jgi:hypothetical protein
MGGRRETHAKAAIALQETDHNGRRYDLLNRYEAERPWLLSDCLLCFPASMHLSDDFFSR